MLLQSPITWAPFALTPTPPLYKSGPNNPHQLGIPTANLPVDAQTPWIDDAKSGVYFGWASLSLPPDHPDRPAGSEPPACLLYPMVMSIGYNPFYRNTVRSAEVHVLHDFSADFYDAHMRLLVLGYVREEKDYASLDALVEDIRFDCDVAKESLRRKGWWPAPSPGVTFGSKVDGSDGVDGGELDVSWLARPLGS